MSEEVNEYDKFSREDLEKLTNEILNSKEVPEIKFVVWRGCKTHGLVKESVGGIGVYHCGDFNCDSCNNWAEGFHKAMKEESKKWEQKEETKVKLNGH